jgi:hypothetical protein
MRVLSRLSWVVVPVGLVGILACGSSSKASSPSSTQNIAADTAAAQAANLKLSDFPPGWTSAPPSSPTGSEIFLGPLANCLGVSEADLSNAPAKADSGDFSQSGMTASSTVDYRATSAQQAAAFNALASPKTPGCLTTVMKAALEPTKQPTSGSTLPAGVKYGQPTVQTMSFPTYGDKTIAYQLKVPTDYNGLSFDGYFDVISVIKGRAGVVMSFNSSPAFPPYQEQHYTELVVGRLTNT